MGKISKVKLSFKKGGRNTGLYAIGTPYNSTEIKINKKIVGQILPPSWNSNNKGWQVMLMIVKKDIMEDGNKNCVWRYITFKKEFEKEELARIWLKDNIDGIMEKWNIFIDREGG